MKRFAKLCTATLLLLALVLALVACDTTVSVTYEKGHDSATGELVVVTAIVGDTLTIAENPFTLDGYQFVGWTDGENNYAVGDKFVVPMHDVELTARWEKILTVAEALAACSDQSGWEADSRVYVRGTVKSIDNPSYGQMTLTDGTSTISVYGSYSADGEKRYSELDEKPYADDEVLLYALLKNFNG